MATIDELLEGKTITVSADAPSAKIRYITDGATDEDDAIDAVIDGTAAYRSFAGTVLTRKRVTLDEAVDVANGKWICTVHWELSDVPEAGGSTPVYTLNTIGGTTLITQSLETVSSGGPKVADHKGAIGWDGERVNGVEIPVRVVDFDILVHHDDADITASFLQTIVAATTKVNSEELTAGPMGTFEPGSLLFHGASVTKRDDGVWDVNYKFSARSNETNLTVGDLTIAEKAGWHHLWLTYESEVDEAAGPGADKSVVIPTASAYYVERVLEEYDLLELDIEGWS